MSDYHHQTIKVEKGPRENSTSLRSPRGWGWRKTQKPGLLGPISEISEDIDLTRSVHFWFQFGCKLGL